MAFPKIAQFKTAEQFRQRLQELNIDQRLPLDAEVLSADAGSPLAAPGQVGRWTVGNRWCIHPMEGWDAEADGSPSPLTLRRWRMFGRSGAKLIWGGEAAAVREDGRANPRQTMAIPGTLPGLRQLRESLFKGHREQGWDPDSLVVGLQLTHSGRFCRPWDDRLAPRIAYHHPLLDPKFGIAADDTSVVWTDDQLEQLIDDYVRSAALAKQAGFQFVDVKACHGYLLHEFLSARRREGRFGGDLQGRSRLLLTIVRRIRQECEIDVGVRLSVFDVPPYQSGPAAGTPMPFETPYEFGFGVAEDNPLQMDLREPVELMRELEAAGVVALNLSCGSPYYCPHIQRPAIFPPSDGYLPPEDPLVGVARQAEAVRLCKQQLPKVPLVGSGYSYLQDYLPHVGQALVRQGRVDYIGLGRMVLSYPELPADCLRGTALQRRRICRTFSDCTTAPRNHLVSGCYPLDEHYKSMPEAAQLKQIKQAQKPGP